MSKTTKASEQLRAWRDKKGLSQKEAAELVGLSQVAWGGLERGAVTPHIATAIAIARETGIPVEAWGA